MSANVPDKGILSYFPQPVKISNPRLLPRDRVYYVFGGNYNAALQYARSILADTIYAYHHSVLDFDDYFVALPERIEVL